MTWGLCVYLWFVTIDAPALVEEQSARRPTKTTASPAMPPKLMDKRIATDGPELVVQPAHTKPVSEQVHSYELWKTLPRAAHKRHRKLYAVPEDEMPLEHDTEIMPARNPPSTQPFRPRRKHKTQKIYYVQQEGSAIDPLIEQALDQEQQDRKKKKKKKKKKNP